MENFIATLKPPIIKRESDKLQFELPCELQQLLEDQSNL